MRLRYVFILIKAFSLVLAGVGIGYASEPWNEFVAQAKSDFSAEQGGALGIGVIAGNTSIASTVLAEPQHFFEMGDLLEPLVSLAVCAQEQSGDSLWDKPLAHWHAGFALNRPQDTEKCTLRHLLGMTAGLSPQADAIWEKIPDATPEEIVALLRQFPPAYPPGDRREESRVSFLAGAYLAAGSWQAWQDAPKRFSQWMRRQVFNPLGLSGNVLLTPRQTQLSMRMEDAMRWLYVEAHGGLKADGSRWLDTERVRMRYLPVQAEDNRQFGLGWQRDYYEGMEMVSRLWVSPKACALIGVFPAYRAAMVLMIERPTREAPLFMQNAFLNMADLLREYPPAM